MISLGEKKKDSLKLLAEGNLTSVNDAIMTNMKLLTKEGKLTGKGLAYAVGYSGASITKHFAKFPESKKDWSEMLDNIMPYMSSDEELDTYFTATMQSYVELDFFRADGWFKDYNNLSKKEIVELRLNKIERFLKLNKVSDSQMQSLMELSRHQLRGQLKQLQD